MDPNARFYGAAADYNKKTPGFDRKFLLMIGGGLLVLLLVFVAFGVISSLGNGPRDRLVTLVAREQSLQTFTANNQAKITNDASLSKTNSEITLFITSDSVSLLAQLKSRYRVSQIPKEITALEADTTSAATLTQATQSGKFNETYKELLAEKLSSTLQLATEVQSGTTGQLNAALEQTIQNIKTLQAQLDANN